MQELQQARLHNSLSDVRKGLADLKSEAQRKLGDYQKEAVNAEKEIVAAERKLMKSKDVLEKCSESRLRTNELNTERSRELNDAMFRAEKDVREDVVALLRVLRNKDQVLLASRRAHQKLDKQCKQTVQQTLKKMLAREREACEAKVETLRKFETAVEDIDVDHDIHDFIEKYVTNEGCLVLQSQALSIMGDLNPSDSDLSPSPLSPSSARNNASSPSTVIAQSGTSSNSNSASSTPRNSFSGPSGASSSASPAPEVRSSRNASMDNTSSAAASLLQSKFANPLPSSPLTDNNDATNKRFSFSADAALQHRAATTNNEQMQSTLTEQVTKHLTRLFYASEDEWHDRPDSMNLPGKMNVLQLAKDRTSPMPVDEAGAKQLITESINWLGENVRSQIGRDAFITVLNQFRSRKVDVGSGFSALGTVLWTTLDMCAQQNDVHSASVIMMLSQVFESGQPFTYVDIVYVLYRHSTEKLLEILMEQ
jgi:hypothetical protein